MKVFQRKLLAYVFLIFIAGVFGRVIASLDFEAEGIPLQPVLLLGGAFVFSVAGGFLLAMLEERNRNQPRKE